MASMTQGVVDLCGDLVLPGEAKVSLFDRGFLFGDGFFETMRTYGGRPFRMAQHLDRLEQAGRALLFEQLPGRAEIEGRIRRLLAHPEAPRPECTLRITITRGVGGGLSTTGVRPTVAIAALPLKTYPEDLYRRGARAVTLWARERGDQPPPWVKSTSYQRTTIARAVASDRGADDGLYTDRAGHLVEGTVSNLFLIPEPGRLVTPPTSHCLPGITRREILAIADEEGWVTEQRTIDPAELPNAAEAFLTSSLAELLPLVAVDDLIVGSGVPGPIALRWRDTYRQRAQLASTSSPLP